MTSVSKPLMQRSPSVPLRCFSFNKLDLCHSDFTMQVYWWLLVVFPITENLIMDKTRMKEQENGQMIYFLFTSEELSYIPTKSDWFHSSGVSLTAHIRSKNVENGLNCVPFLRHPSSNESQRRCDLYEDRALKVVLLEK